MRGCCDGERGRNRTFNLGIKSPLLCQLSYAPTVRSTVRTPHPDRNPDLDVTDEIRKQRIARCDTSPANWAPAGGAQRVTRRGTARAASGVQRVTRRGTARAASGA